MAVNVVMPPAGESVVEGTLEEWRVKEGDRVAKDASIGVISTDKAEIDLLAPVSGVITKLLVPPKTTVKVGAALAIVDETAAAAPTATPVTANDAASGAAAANPPLSPAVKKLSRELGLDPSQVAGSGERGRVTKQDVLRAAEAPPAAPVVAAAVPTPAAAPAVTMSVPSPSTASVEAPAVVAGQGLGAFQVPPFNAQPGDEIVPFSRRRRIIADHMVYSKHVAPHVMTIAEIDMQKTHKLRESRKTALKAEGVNLTFLSFVAFATVRALRDNPVMNARVLDNAYAKIKRIHLGIAVETPQGLVVPVIRNADDLSVRGLAKAIEDTATKARDGKIGVEDLRGATFTISNPGLKGNFVGAAVISQPNVGILRIGEIVKRPVVVEVEGQDHIAIHPVMFAALSYDHRIVDGVAANNFLYQVTEWLEAGKFEV